MHSRPFDRVVLVVAVALVLPFSAIAIAGQGGAIWDEAAPETRLHGGANGRTIPATVFPFDADVMGRALAAAREAGDAVQLPLPMPSGEFVAFWVREAPTLSPALQAVRPQLRTYSGTGVEDPSLHVRFTSWPQGILGRVEGEDGWTFDSTSPESAGEMLVWRNADDPQDVPFECGVVETAKRDGIAPEMETARLGSDLHVYELAVSAPGEFTQFHGSVSQAEAQITTLVNLANAIWERDLAVRMEIVDLNVYSDPATDPFLTGTVMDNNLLAQNHDALIAKLGVNGFDLGHVVGRRATAGWQGLAQVGVQCDTFSKGKGGILASAPTASSLLEGILHEMGHQLGALHSFNGTTGNCGGNRTADAAFELASGVSIMSYAGTCGAENITATRLLMYDAGALEAIADRIAGSSCDDEVPSGNTPPVADAGPNYVIPRETAFVLDGSTSSDADADVLTYSWEQHDLGHFSPPYGPLDGPLLRNFAQVSSPLRSVPSYVSYVVAGYAPWEFLPTVDRNLTFRLVVRDNHAGAGGVAWDTSVLTVSGEPFRVLSPNGNESFSAGAPFTVQWEPGGGAVAANVRILVSTDQAVTWTEVEASTPNDGSQMVVMPCDVSSSARVRVEPVGNIFFDISDANFTVTADATPPEVICPGPFTVTASGPTGIDKDDPALSAWIAMASATDNCDPDPAVAFAAPPTIPLGVNTVAFTAVDAHNNLEVCTTQLTVEEATAAPGLPARTALTSIHPNPFNPSTTIGFELGSTQPVTLEILDPRGRRIEVLHDGVLGAGAHEIVWHARGASGVYYARLVTADGVFRRRLVLLK